MKQLTLLLMVFITISISAQTFEQDLPDEFTSFGIALDPLGSLDKEGINLVGTISVLDHGWLEWYVHTQTVFTTKETEDNNWNWDYTDFFFGPSVFIPLNNRITVSPGIHVGGIFRPFGGNWSYGGRVKGRWFMGKQKIWCFTLESTLDHAPDKPNRKPRFNTRGGIEILLL